METLELVETKDHPMTLAEATRALQTLVDKGKVQLPQYNDNETELDTVLSGLAWQDEFKLGFGVNAVNGETAASALKKFTPVPSTTKTTTQYYKLITHQSDASLEVQASLSGHYNINGVTVSASMEYLKQLDISELAITLLARYESACVDYDEAERYELTEDAKKLLKESPDKFRDQYGDYFISGGKRGSRFVALYTFKAKSLKDMTSFKASLAGEAPNVFRAEGSTSLKRSAAENNVQIETRVFMEGYEGAPPPPDEDILKQLEWFKAHERGIYLRAKLRLYSTIDASVPRVVKIAPAAFAELRKLYSSVWVLRARYASCPANYQGSYADRFSELDSAVVSQQKRLAVDNILRVALQKKVNELNADLEAVYNRMAFYFEVQSRMKDEMEQGKQIEQKRGETLWNYGFNATYKKDGVSINTQSKQVRPEAAVGHGKAVALFPENHSQLIVGWTIRSDWNYNNGWWMKVSDQIILRHKAEVAFWSILSSFAEWTIEIYTVDDALYKFDR